MNIALVALGDINLTPIITDLKPTVILTSARLPLAKRLAEIAIQLDELIYI